jgi:hypothetical protein
MMNILRFASFCALVASTLLLASCNAADDRKQLAASCAKLDYISGGRVRTWDQQGVTLIAQIHDISLQCPPESGANRHVVRITLRVAARERLASATIPYIVQVKTLSGRAIAKQRLERQVRFLPGSSGVQVTDFFEHRYASNSEPLIYEVGLDP